MGKNINLKDLNLSLVNLLYQQYKSFILPAVVILVSLIVILMILIPQAQGLLQNQELLKEEQEKLSVLKNNYKLLVSMDEAQVSGDLQTLSKAFPSNKDFAGILNTISYNSVRSGVSISDFTFQVGDVKKTTDTDNPDSPSLKLRLNISASPGAVIKFVSELYRSFPIAQATVIKSNQEQANITLTFPFKAFPELKVDNFTSLNQLSASETKLIEQIQSYNDTSLVFSFPLEDFSSEATSSATKSTNPFE